MSTDILEAGGLAYVRALSNAVRRRAVAEQAKDAATGQAPELVRGPQWTGPLASGGVRWHPEGSAGIRRGRLASGRVGWRPDGSAGVRDDGSAAVGLGRQLLPELRERVRVADPELERRQHVPAGLSRQLAAPGLQLARAIAVGSGLALG